MDYKTPLPPFKWFILENFPYIEEDFDAITNWQLFCKLGKEMNKIIEKTNLTGEQVEQLTNAFNTLKTYVDDYFENLDVQDEIDNKLDELVEDGTLAEILSQYINNPTMNFDTIADLEAAENLAVGNICKVNGLEAINDGFSAKYKIESTGTENGLYCIKIGDLYAKIINNYGKNYYDEITYEVIRYEDTNCYVTTIPKFDTEGNQISPYVSQRQSSLTPNEDAQKNGTNVTINASLSIMEDGQYQDASVIANGAIIRDHDMPTLADGYTYVGIKADNSIVGYQANSTTAEDMLEDGCVQAFLGFYQIVANGVQQPKPEGVTIGLADKDQYLCQKSNGDIFIFTVDGRNPNNKGLTNTEAATKMIELGANNAFMLDGGGSTSTSFRGIKINENYDDEGITDRKIGYLLNFKKTIVNDSEREIYNEIGKTKQLLNRQLRPLINDRIDFARFKPLTTFVAISGTNVTIPLESTYNGSKFIELTEDNGDYYFKAKVPGIVIVNSSIRLSNIISGNAYLVLKEEEGTVLSSVFPASPNSVLNLSATQTTILYNNIDIPKKLRLQLDAPNGTTIHSGQISVIFIPFMDFRLNEVV